MSDSPNPSYSFHGSNSSHSKDNGSGGRTYHIPNYATSYANEKSRLVTVSFDEDKGTSKAILAIVVVFLVIAAVPLSMIASNFGKHSVSWPDAPPEYGYPERNGLSASDEADIGALPAPQAHQEEEEDAPWALDERAQVRWSTPMPADHCTGYGTKVYTAELQGVSFFKDQGKACRSTPVVIQNVYISAPVKCETKGVFRRRMIGHWVAPSNDTGCSPRWGKFVDKGCIRGGVATKRYESRLWDIRQGEDWMTLCTTAPATINQVAFVRPKLCDDRGIWGIYGIWHVKDSNCPA